MKEAQKIIDIHTHIFNLKYLPVYGTLRSRGLKIGISRAIEWILIKLTKSSNLRRTQSQFFKKIEFNFNEFSKIDKFSMYSFTKNEGVILEDKIIDIIIDEVIDNYIYEDKFVLKALDDLEGEEELEDIEKNILFDIDNAKSNSEQKELIKSSLRRKLKGLLNKSKPIFNYLNWFFFMMKSEKKIYQLLDEEYGDHANSNVTNYVFHMLDGRSIFKNSCYHRNSPTFYKIKTQINRMKKMMDLNTKLIGFLPYNPLKNKSLEIIKDNIGNGFKGVKFYPSFGYQPIYLKNGELDNKSENKINKRKINKNNLKLFRYCIDKNIPILTHCTPMGFEAKTGDGKNCNPKYWKDLLTYNNGEFKNLTLCLGHAGGEKGWKSEFKESSNDPFPVLNGKTPFAKEVYNLCITYENVYCEVGFLAHIHESKDLKNYIKKLNYLYKLDVNTTNSFKFREKMMYGSDWHILYNNGIEADYDQQYIKIFSKTNKQLHQYKDDFFYKNAEKFLKIVPSNQIDELV